MDLGIINVVCSVCAVIVSGLSFKIALMAQKLTREISRDRKLEARASHLAAHLFETFEDRFSREGALDTTHITHIVRDLGEVEAFHRDPLLGRWEGREISVGSEVQVFLGSELVIQDKIDRIMFLWRSAARSERRHCFSKDSWLSLVGINTGLTSTFLEELWPEYGDQVNITRSIARGARVLPKVTHLKKRSASDRITRAEAFDELNTPWVL